MFRHYFRLMLFAMGLLSGIQIPAFIDTYQTRVDAHLKEATLNLAGFQSTADRYFSGSMAKLIAHYQASEDQVFREDAMSIQSIYQRKTYLQNEWNNMQQGPVQQLYHLLVQRDSALMNETLAQYNYTVPLTPQALLWGAAVAFLLAWLLELSGLMVVKGTGRMLNLKCDHLYKPK